MTLKRKFSKWNDEWGYSPKYLYMGDIETTLDCRTPCVVLYSSQVSTFSLFLYVKDPQTCRSLTLKYSFVLSRQTRISAGAVQCFAFLMSRKSANLLCLIDRLLFFLFEGNIHLTLLGDLLFIFCSDGLSILLLVLYYRSRSRAFRSVQHVIGYETS